MQDDEVRGLPEVQGAGVAESGIGRDGSGWGVHGVRGDLCPKCTVVLQGTMWKDGQRN